MLQTSTCSIRKFPSWYGAALSMDTVTRASALKLQPGNGQLLKPKRLWCNAPNGTFTQNTCGLAPYVMRRVLRLVVQPGLPPRCLAQLLHPTRLDPTYLQGNQPLLQEQNRLPHLRRVNQPASRPPQLPTKHTPAVEQPPTQQQAQRTLPPLARRSLRPEPARHRQFTPLGRLHPTREPRHPPTRFPMARTVTHSQEQGRRMLPIHRRHQPMALPLPLHSTSVALPPPMRRHFQLPTRSLHPVAQPPRDALAGKPPPAIRRPVRMDRPPAHSRLVE